MARRPGDREHRERGPSSSFGAVAERSIASFKACWQELIEADVEILDPPKDESYGHRTLFFRDPERNVLEIYADIEPC